MKIEPVARPLVEYMDILTCESCGWSGLILTKRKDGTGMDYLRKGKIVYCPECGDKSYIEDHNLYV